MKRKYKTIMMMALVLVILLTACGGSDFPVGTYEREVGGGKILFTSDGEFTIYSGDLVNRGSFSYKDNVLTWETDERCELISMHNNATYKLTLEDDVLSFTLVGQDKCLEREAFLVRANWIKQEE